MELGSLLHGLQGGRSPEVIVGYDTSDDAGVYRISDEVALVQTVDFITPVCDDPYAFGQVAAANALSDVFAMGGSPLTALNICCFPATGIPDGVYRRILEGGLDKIAEAGAELLGGHTVKDDELKYGLSVTGTVHPDRVLTNGGARAGDILVLTKPLGTGVIIGGHRKGLVSPGDFDGAIAWMARLNGEASRAAAEHGARACTDVTGFGLAGHAMEMAQASGCGLSIRAGALPLLPGAADLLEMGIATGMAASNRAMVSESIAIDEAVPTHLRALLFDPQTSGGLLLSMGITEARELLEALPAADRAGAAVIGEVTALPPSASPALTITG